MAIDELKYMGQEAAEQLIQNTKAVIDQKLDDHNSSFDTHNDIRLSLVSVANELLKTVRFTEQPLNESQQQQARTNIGITGTGADGYTPVRGVDYWTDEDKAEIKSYVNEAILGGAW